MCVHALSVRARSSRRSLSAQGSSRGGVHRGEACSVHHVQRGLLLDKKAPEHIYMLCWPCLLAAQIHVCVQQWLRALGGVLGGGVAQKGCMVPAVVAKRSCGCASDCSSRVSERWTSGVHLCTGLRDGLLVVWIVRGAVCASVAFDLVSLVYLTALIHLTVADADLLFGEIMPSHRPETAASQHVPAQPARTSGGLSIVLGTQALQIL